MGDPLSGKEDALSTLNPQLADIDPRDAEEIADFRVDGLGALHPPSGAPFLCSMGIFAQNDKCWRLRSYWWGIVRGRIL